MWLHDRKPSSTSCEPIRRVLEQRELNAIRSHKPKSCNCKTYLGVQGGESRPGRRRHGQQYSVKSTGVIFGSSTGSWSTFPARAHCAQLRTLSVRLSLRSQILLIAVYAQWYRGLVRW